MDGIAYGECLYRLREDGHAEILAFGARVVVPIKALPLLPEPIARAVLVELAERAASALRAAANSASAEEEHPEPHTCRRQHAHVPT